MGEYIKVDMSIEEAIDLYKKYQAGEDKIQVLLKEEWSDGVITCPILYKGYELELRYYSDDDIKIAFNDTSDEARKVIDELDFIIYYPKIQQRLRGQ